MPQLDFASMAILIAINLAAIGLALPWAMGSPVSPAARHVQRYFLLQALGWSLILVASRIRGTFWDPVLSLSATCAAAAAQWQMAQALQCWLGPRPLRWLVIGLAILGPLGFAWWLHDIPTRLAWYSLYHGTSVACLGWMCLHPLRPVARGWRYLMAACATTMSLGLLARAYLAYYTPWLREFAHDSAANYLFAILAQLCSSLALVSMLVAWRDETNQKLRDMAWTDQLTGLANRHALLQTAPRMQSLAQRQHLPLAVVLLDLDHFKNVNDQYGHTTGDHALQLVAKVLHAEMRPNEMASRWGGEEFCLLLHADADGVQSFYQRFSAALLQRAQQELGFALHISAGCALQTDSDQNLDQLLQRADTALYQAKSQGRRRLVFGTVVERPQPPTALSPAQTPA